MKGFDSEDTSSNFTFPGHYHRTVATLVHGDLNPKYVGCDNEECMTDAYFFVDPTHNINSIAKLVSVNKYDLVKTQSHIKYSFDFCCPLFLKFLF